MRKKLIVIGIITLVIVGYLLYSGVKNVVTNTPTPTPDPYAGWNTYTNDEYGFSIQFPKDWSITKEDSGKNTHSLTISSSETEEYVYIYNARQLSSLSIADIDETMGEIENYGNNRSNTEQGNFIQKPIAGTVGITAHSVDLESNKYVEIYLPHVSKGYILSITHPDSEENDGVVNSILETFRIF